jgi:hypothetical protein
MDRFEAMGATLYTAPGLVPGCSAGAAGAGRGAGWRSRARRTRRRGSAPSLAEPPRVAGSLLLTLAYAAAALLGRLPFGRHRPCSSPCSAGFSRPKGRPGAGSWLAALAGVVTAVVVVLVFERMCSWSACPDAGSAEIPACLTDCWLFGQSIARFRHARDHLLALLSSLVGVIIGALPGLTATMGARADDHADLSSCRPTRRC